MKKAFFIPLGVIVVLLIVVIFLVYKNLNAVSVTPSSALPVANDQRVDIEKPRATFTINKKYTFPLTDATGKEISKFTYYVDNAELRDEIIIQGKKSAAVQGRTFLVINLRVTNALDKAIQVQTRDYIRLSMNGSSELLAPDIYNDPTEVQAISTKYTRVGFAISDTDKNLLLHIGPIDGKKDIVPLNFK